MSRKLNMLSVGSKLKSMVGTRKKAEIPDAGASAPPPSAVAGAVEVQFEPASTTLDIATQARENLKRFRRFLECDPTDRHGDFDTISRTMALAFSEFTNRTANLRSQLSQARAAAEDFAEQEATTIARRADFSGRLARLRSERAELEAALDQVTGQNARFEEELRARKLLEKSISAHAAAREDLGVRLANLRAELETEVKRTGELGGELARLAEENKARNEQWQSDIAKSEARIRELTVAAKRAEMQERQVRFQNAEKEKKRKTEAFNRPIAPNISAFMIDDNVKISQDELAELRFMIRSLQKDNEIMENEKNSKMMDVDCLGQENLGLKQLIRQASEGT
jgi:DNA repair exonuclease SbcCD ATPase subunit